jgi:hypothetical protein
MHGTMSRKKCKLFAYMLFYAHAAQHLVRLVYNKKNMCAGCGIPTTHSLSLTQWIGIVSITSFSLLTFLIAWWILASSACKRLLHRILDHYFPTTKK